MLNKLYTIVLILLSQAFLLNSGLKAENKSYLNQIPPGNEPELFAPEFISDGFNNRDMAIMPDGSELYYAVNHRQFDLATILVSYQVKGKWSKPEVAPFATDMSYKYLEPAISPDGSKMYFVAAKRGDTNNDIWVMERTGDGWGQQKKLSAIINTSVSETFPSLTNDGTLFFSRAGENPQIEHIYRSRLVNGQYTEAERLPDVVNSGKTQFNAFVAPDESYLIVSVYGREDSIGSIDYYIVYRNQDDQWSKPVNMGDKINTKSGQEYSAYVSRDGKYLFFMSTRLPKKDNTDQKYSYKSLNKIHNSPENGQSDIYWMSAEIIEQLRPDGF